jgi:flagellin
MRINNNFMAMNMKNQMKKTNKLLSDKMEKLSSGKRINKAADDASGLSISQKMRAQIRGLDQASRNIQDAVSLIQTGESALDEIGDITHRMRELSVQAANDTLTNDDRDKIQNEINTLKDEINSIANNTEFNNIQLLNGIIANDTYTRSFEPAIEIPENGEIITQNFNDVFPDLDISMDFYEDEEGKIQIATKEKTTKGINILGSMEYDKINDQPSIEWEKDIAIDVYSPPNESDVLSMIKTKDGILVNKRYGALTEIDQEGNVLWEKHIGENLFSLSQTSDGGFIGLNRDGKETNAIKLNSEGEEQWTEVVNSDDKSYSYGEEIIELANNKGYAYSGSISSSEMEYVPNDPNIHWKEHDSVIKKLDNDLNTIWEKTYEGYDQSLEDKSARDNFSNIVEDGNGNIFVVGVESQDLIHPSDSSVPNRGVIRKYYPNGDEKKELISSDQIRELKLDSIDSLVIIDGRGNVRKFDNDLNSLAYENFNGNATSIEIIKNDNILVTSQDSSENLRVTMLNSDLEEIWEVDVGKELGWGGEKAIRTKDGSYLFSAAETDNIIRLSNDKTLKMSLDDTKGDKNIVTFDDVTIEIKNGKLSKIDIPYDGSLDIQVGANEGQQNNIAISDMRTEALGMTNGYPKVVPREAAEVSIEISDHALNKINAERSKLGAKQNALEHTQKNVDNSAEQLQKAESQITDADMAKEMMEFTKYNILKESTQSMLSQAKTIPEQVLNLLKNV